MEAKTEEFNFENLDTYKKALDYVDFIYELVKKFPGYELYDLTRQFKRAAYSIALNIGERRRFRSGILILPAHIPAFCQ